MKTKKCEKCEKEIAVSGIKRHTEYCGKKKEIIKKYEEIDGKYKCPECNELIEKNKIGFHIIWNRCAHKEKISWNKGLTKENDERVRKNVESQNKVRNDSEYISPNIGRVISSETRNKISESMKKYYQENPDKIPYLVHHNSKGESYPEKYFTKLFEKENIEVIKKYRIRLYELDFCILNKRIDIEIDGDQHHRDKRIVESDIRRNKYLESLGWTIIRIKWSEYQKMNFDEKSIYIQKLKNYINDLCETKPTIEYKKCTKGKDLCECGKEKEKRSKNCMECRRQKSIQKEEIIIKKEKNKNVRTYLNKRKVERPSLEQLLQEVEDTNYCAVGRKYGVSDNAIRKWIKSYRKE